jgi:hypothetical protein
MGEWEVKVKKRKGNLPGVGPAFQLDVVPNVTERELAWTVGIIEGEGYFHASSHIEIIVTQKDPWILYRLQAFYGGSITRHVKPPNKVVSTHFVIYDWRLSGGRARGLANAIQTDLSPRRREQLRKALTKHSIPTDAIRRSANG